MKDHIDGILRAAQRGGLHFEGYRARWRLRQMIIKQTQRDAAPGNLGEKAKVAT